jgi:hypothetical protein
MKQKPKSEDWMIEFDKELTVPIGMSSSPTRSNREWDRIIKYGLRLKDEYDIKGIKSFI